MPKVPDIKFDDITIAENYLGGYKKERCKVGLWNIYNVIKKIISDYSNDLPLHYSNSDQDTGYAKVLECLYMIGVNAKPEDNTMTSLVYNGKTNKNYKRNMPNTKYLFQLEKYGFLINNIVTLKNNIPKNKLAVKDIVQFSLYYSKDDFNNVIFGLKLFSDICMKQTGDCFYSADIRVAFIDAPKLYAPPADEIFYFLPEDQKNAAYTIHSKLKKLECIPNLEREYMTRYLHPKSKGKTFATIYASESLYSIPLEFQTKQKVVFKLNLRNIGKYTDYLSECTESIRQTIFGTEDCGACKKKCGGVVFTYQNKTYIKCPWHIFRFYDLSKNAIENYVKLLEMEDKVLQNK
jgi:hypothetical protein